MNLKNKKELLEYLNSQNLMTLATCDRFSWVAAVYYVVDKDMNLYFVSSPKSKHCQDIEKNNKVACCIYDSHIPNSSKKIGIQLQGIASQVKGWNKTRIYLKMWNKAAPGAKEMINVTNMINKVISSRIYKIRPNYIKFFNELLGEEKYLTYKLN